MADQPDPLGSTVAPDPTPDQAPTSFNDVVVLAVLDEGPAHGFALSRQFDAGSDLGRIVTLARPQVYRSLDRLAIAGLIEAITVEPGDGAPQRTVFASTEGGAAAVAAWLAEPVAHVRDLRVPFLAKLRLLERRGASPTELLTAQRAALGPTLDQLIAAGDVGDTGQPVDVVDRWRAHNAEAVARFLTDVD